MNVIDSNATAIALLFIAIAYAVSLLRNWRPIRALREENSDLRATVAQLQHSNGVLEKKYADLEHKYEILAKSRDFQSAFDGAMRAIDQTRADSTHEHERMLAALVALEERSEAAWTEITRGLSANTSVVAALAAGINAGTVGTAPKGG